MRRFMKGRAIVVGLLVLGGVGWGVVGGIGGDSDADWVDVERGEMVIGVELTGTLRAVDSGTLGPPQIPEMWNFKIAHMAPEGEEVAEGALVLAFDASELEQQLQEMMAEAQEARKQIEKTRKELSLEERDNALRLHEARGRHRKAQLKVDVPPELKEGQELETARLELALAEQEIAYLEERSASSKRAADASLAALQAQLDQAEAKVAEMQSAIAQMSIKAPRDGTVVYVTNWQDEKKKVGDSCWRGESVIELPDLDKMMAKGQVDEADAGRVAEGQRVKLRLDAHPDVEFTGRVRSIWRTVRRESWRTPLKVVRMDVDLDETDRRRMRPGMRFRGEAEVERLEDVLLVPAEAVFATADGPVVYRKTLFGHEVVPVTIGRRNQSEVEVLGGLEEGDTVSRTDLAREEEEDAA